ncbi:hypothetical protein E4U61_007295 [Claviceps capensis]|nr:hypothetical protein E4U61_007295 [Claviceps capensis]
MRAFSLLTVLLPFVVARGHPQCDCMSWKSGESWIHNAELTRYVCFQYYPGDAQYDDESKVCKTTDSSKSIDGQGWEDNCKNAGIDKGYYPFGTDGKPDFSQKIMYVGAASGAC